MKNCIILLTALSLLGFTSCKSNEDKANELIRAELSKTLYDFDSYQPIETIVQKAKNTTLNNKKCWDHAMLAILSLDMAAANIKKANEANEYMEILGPPTSYSSSRSDREYEEYKDKKEEHIANGKINLKIFAKLTDSLKILKKELDTTQIIGWEVHHKFRCKTKGGYASIANYKYLIDKNFDKIIFQIDTDDKKYASIVELLATLDKTK